VNPSVPAKDIKELLALIRGNPGKYSFAGPGVGSTPHLAGEQFRLAFNLDLVHVPFTGAGPAIQSTIGGHTPIAFTALPPALAAVKDGKLRMLGVATPQRATAVPEVATFAEQGIKDQDSDTLTGLVVPAATPKEIVDLLQKEIAKSVAQPDVKEKLATLGFVPVANTPDDVLDAISRERVTVGFGNPDLLDALTLRPGWTTADLSSLRFVITGGAPVPERLIRTYGERGVTFLQGYGLSEASPVVSVLDAASATRKADSAGRPLLFVDVRTARQDGSECAPGETGELFVKGPTVMAGYWNRPDATRATIDDRGWLRTGDAARIDEEGFVWIVDRVEDAFTADGYVVYPGDVERCIGEHRAVRDVGVVGVDGSARAFVVLHDGGVASATDIIEHCRARLDRRAVPASIVFVEALPRTSVGKLDRPALLERALASP